MEEDKEKAALIKAELDSDPEMIRIYSEMRSIREILESAKREWRTLLNKMVLNKQSLSIEENKLYDEYSNTVVAQNSKLFFLMQEYSERRALILLTRGIIEEGK